MSYKDKNKKRITLNQYWKRHTFKRLAKLLRRKSKWTVKIRDIDLWSILKKQKLICPLTGHKITKENISVDHIIPKSKGGSEGLANIRFVTKSANMAKYNLTDEEFIKLCNAVIDNVK